MAATVSQVRGMLLEEAILYLLRRTGYNTVDVVGTDPTLENGSAGLCVRGRGSKHQIDAIADWCFHPPFTNPQRLLVEAKCYSANYPIGLEVTRNAVGVLKDVSEYWVPSGPEGISTRRYHYLSAIFSASGFTARAQEYAFAQDIYLLSLEEAAYFEPIVDAIRNVRPRGRSAQGNPSVDVEMRDLRRRIRQVLAQKNQATNNEIPSGGLEGVDAFIGAVLSLEYVLLAMLAGQFPVVLVPSPEVRGLIGGMGQNGRQLVRIRYDRNRWYLHAADREEQVLFSFDLPPVLFQQYADRGRLSRIGALNMKSEMMSSFQAFWRIGDQVRVIDFVMDPDWLDGLINQVNEKAERQHREDREE